MTPDVFIPRCNVCSVPSGPTILRCGGCKVALYCGKEHQTSDWPSHKSVCKLIKRSANKLEKEDTALRNHPGDFMMQDHPFENSVGYFWGIVGTRDYMRARIDHVLNVLKVNSQEAVKTSLNHLLDMLRLCRGDNLGVRDIVPGLFLRLKRDQECYDFAKWYATTGREGGYNWGDMDLPFCNLKGEDMMESVEVFCGRWQQAHAVPVTLIKVRMLLDLRDFLSSPTDEVDYSKFRSSLWAARPELLERDGLEARVQLLKKQVDKIFKSVDEENKHVWKGLLESNKYLAMMPGAYSKGSPEEMVLLVHYNARAWLETDGALEWLKAKVR